MVLVVSFYLTIHSFSSSFYFLSAVNKYTDFDFDFDCKSDALTTTPPSHNELS